MGLTKQAVAVAVDRRRRINHGIVRAVLDRMPGQWARRLEYEWLMVPRAEYAHGMARAGALARALGVEGFTAIEFGVAGGNGLIAMERHAERLSADLDLTIDVVGFDRGIGMPSSDDHRDPSYFWKAGDYAMDEEGLRRRLSTAQLIVGNVSTTARGYRPRLPIGFVSFDMDYYSSTLAALAVFEGLEWDRWLPRIYAYFDDIRTIEWVGERKAISEWNEANEDRKIGQVLGVRDTIFGSPPWAPRVFEIHFFDHPAYATPIGPASQMPLHPS